MKPKYTKNKQKTLHITLLNFHVINIKIIFKSILIKIYHLEQPLINNKIVSINIILQNASKL